MIGSIAPLVAAAFIGSQVNADWQAIENRSDQAVPGVNIFRIAGSSSDEIGVKIQLLNRAPSGNVITIQGSRPGEPTKSFAFKMVFEGVPAGRTFQFWMQDQGMRADGLPPVPVPNGDLRYTVDQSGRWRAYGRGANGSPKPPAFSAVNFAKGEWIQIELRSTDGQVSKAFRFTPYK